MTEVFFPSRFVVVPAKREVLRFAQDDNFKNKIKNKSNDKGKHEVLRFAQDDNKNKNKSKSKRKYEGKREVPRFAQDDKAAGAGSGVRVRRPFCSAAQARRACSEPGPSMRQVDPVLTSFMAAR
jgi:hypothetical protein